MTNRAAWKLGLGVMLAMVVIALVATTCTQPEQGPCHDLERPTPARACDLLRQVCPEAANGRDGYTCEELVILSWPLPGENGDDRVRFGYNPDCIQLNFCSQEHYWEPPFGGGCEQWERACWCGKTGKNGCVPAEPPRKLASPEAEGGNNDE